MLKILLQPYLKKIADLAFLMVKVWMWVICFCFGYAIFSSIKWYQNVQRNAELEIQLVQNKGKIDSIKIYQSFWKNENDTLRKRINALDYKIRTLDIQLNQDLKNDKITTHKPVFNADSILRLFTNRYGKGSVRHQSVRVDTLENAARRKRKR